MCGILVPRSGDKHWSLPHPRLQWKLRVPTIGPPGNSPHVTLIGNQSCDPPKLHWWRRQCQPSPVLLPEKSHGQRSLVGCSPWCHEGSDTTERLHFHFSLSCIGEGNGKPLQCSCLENPRDGRAWWAAVYGVSQRRTQLK